MGTYSQLLKQAGMAPGTIKGFMNPQPAAPEPPKPLMERPASIDTLMPGELRKTNFTNPPQPKPVNTPDPIKPQPAGEGQKDITPPAVTEPPQEQQTGNATFSSFLQSLWHK